MRYLLLLLLAGCTASNWTKQGASNMDFERDYDQCREIAKPDVAVAAAFGAFGALGVLGGTTWTDSKIRSCLAGRGWNKQDTTGAPEAQPKS